MANITEILGTDSLSSSRITINGNFSSLNNELAEITTILDTTNSNISGLSSVTTESITIQSANVLIAQATTASFQIAVSTEFDDEVSLGGRLLKNGVWGSPSTPNNPVTNPPSFSTGSYTTYVVNNTIVLEAGGEGQEITIINVAAGPINVVSGTQGGALGATSLQLDGNNSTVTLRYISDRWYIISHVGATIVL
jgi:hypothetical protein